MAGKRQFMLRWVPCQLFILTLGWKCCWKIKPDSWHKGSTLAIIGSKWGEAMFFLVSVPGQQWNMWNNCAVEIETNWEMESAPVLHWNLFPSLCASPHHLDVGGLKTNNLCTWWHCKKTCLLIIPTRCFSSDNRAANYNSCVAFALNGCWQ